MPSYQYRKSHCRDKTVVRSSYLHNGNSYTGKMTSLYWIRAQYISLSVGWAVGIREDLEDFELLILPSNGVLMLIFWMKLLCFRDLFKIHKYTLKYQLWLVAICISTNLVEKKITGFNWKFWGKKKTADILPKTFSLGFECKVSYLYSGFTEIHSQWSSWQKFRRIGSSYGLPSNRWEAITWTNVDPVHWCIPW